jgi:hypothetical protein
MERTLEDLVWRRAGGRCEYCQLAQADLDLAFEVDHIAESVPPAHGFSRTAARPGATCTML